MELNDGFEDIKGVPKTLTEALKSYHFSDSAIAKIIAEQKREKYADGTLAIKLYKIFLSFRKFNFTDEQIVKAISRVPKILSHEVEAVGRIFDNLEKKEYTDPEIIKMVDTYPTLATLGEKAINNRFQYFQDKCYIDEETNQKVSRYSDKEIKHIIKVLPQILGYSQQKLDDIYDVFYEVGYTTAETDIIINKHPAIFSTNPGALKDKIILFDQIGMKRSTLLHNPTRLIQSAALTYARWKLIGPKKPISGYFRDAITFGLDYGVTSAELLEMFPYVPNSKRKTV